MMRKRISLIRSLDYENRCKKDSLFQFGCHFRMSFGSRYGDAAGRNVGVLRRLQVGFIITTAAFLFWASGMSL